MFNIILFCLCLQTSGSQKLSSNPFRICPRIITSIHCYVTNLSHDFTSTASASISTSQSHLVWCCCQSAWQGYHTLDTHRDCPIQSTICYASPVSTAAAAAAARSTVWHCTPTKSLQSRYCLFSLGSPDFLFFKTVDFPSLILIYLLHIFSYYTFISSLVVY